jgi:hypothetical protein
VKGADPEQRSKVITTLANLLESKREVTRLVAAENLYPFHHHATISRALETALRKEKVVAIKATLLRQRCWLLGSNAEKFALSFLRRPFPSELLRAEAVACVGRQGKASLAATEALREAWRQDDSPLVKRAACVALAAVGAKEALAEMTEGLLLNEMSDCSATALAAMGTRAAYEALLQGIEDAHRRGHLSPQGLGALFSFSQQPFFAQTAIERLLVEIINDGRIGWVSRIRAIEELARTPGQQLLQKVASNYKEPLSDNDRYVQQALERWRATQLSNKGQ